MPEINRWLAADKASELTGENNMSGAPQQERMASLRKPITCGGGCIHHGFSRGEAAFQF